MNQIALKLYTKLQTLKCDEGQDLVEYALLVSLIALAAIAGVNNVANAINGVFTKISTSI